MEEGGLERNIWEEGGERPQGHKERRLGRGRKGKETAREGD